MKKANSEQDFDVVVWDKGEKMDFSHCIGQLLPTELHIKPDGTKEDKPSFAFLLQNADGQKWCAQISERMLLEGLKKAKELMNIDISVEVSRILDRHLPSEGVGTERENLRMKLHTSICQLINTY